MPAKLRQQRFPMRIEVQCKNFKFWFLPLTLTKNENELSQNIIQYY